MGQVFENGLGYSVEFVKLMLVVKYMMGYKLKKWTGTMFGASLLFVLLASVWVDVSEFTMTFGMLSIGIIAFNTTGKKRLLKVTLCFLGISIIDMAIGSLVMFFMNLRMQQVDENGMIIPLINSISLFLIGVYSMIAKRRNREKFRVSDKMTPVYVIAGVILTNLLASLQFVELGEELNIYRHETMIILNATVVIFVIICVVSNRNQNENERLKLENRMNQSMLESQRDYYLVLLDKEKETKSFRHDIRQQISCIRLLYDKEEYGKLGQYISELEQATLELSPKYNTGNDFVNAIINDLNHRFSRVNLEWTGKMPLLKLSYMDVCTLFYNLLKNAFEAADKTDEKKIKAVVKTYDASIVV